MNTNDATQVETRPKPNAETEDNGKGAIQGDQLPTDTGDPKKDGSPRESKKGIPATD